MISKRLTTHLCMVLGFMAMPPMATQVWAEELVLEEA